MSTTLYLESRGIAVQEIVDLYVSGSTLNSLCRKFDVCKKTIRKLLLEKNVIIDTKRREPKKKFSQEYIDNLVYKKCSKCSEWLFIFEFRKRGDRQGDGYRQECIKCMTLRDQTYHNDHRESRSARNKEWRERTGYSQVRDKNENAYAQRVSRKLHPQKAKDTRDRYYRKNREAILKRESERPNHYYINNKERVMKQQAEYTKAREKVDIGFRILRRLRSRMRDTIKRCSGKKSKKTMELVGCHIEYLKYFLESKFLEGMSWDNYGSRGWHIDHIRPCSSFDLTDPEQQKQCFHYTNLQPLWATDNLKKSDKLSYSKDLTPKT